MNEMNNKKREWVKTAAIIFLSVMLILTFFSNTIMNYSLPEVATELVESGTITAKIRGGGTVESSDAYKVKIERTRTVKSVVVDVGDEVQAGDVLIYLEDTESEELKAAEEALKAAQSAYDYSILAADVDAQIIQDAKSDISSTTYRQQIDAAQAEVAAAQAAYNKIAAEYEASKNADGEIEEVDLSEETEARDKAYAAKIEADFALTAAQNEQERIADLLEYEMSLYEDVSDGDISDIPSIAELMRKKQAADMAVINAKTVARDAQLAYDKAEAALNKKKEEASSGNSSNTGENGEPAELTRAKKVLTEKETALSELISNINKTLELETQYQAIIDAQELVEKERSKSISAVITAEIAGTIVQLDAASGDTLSPDDEAVAVIQPEGKGYTMSFTVTNEQAKRLSVGDKAELVNSWFYNDMDVTLASIKPDPENPSKQKKLTFNVKGEVTVGQSLSVSVGQKSANYDLIVPNSAIREDNNGKFILIVESKSSPLGNRYMATRVDVEVIASDDTKSAISGALYGYEYVITTATKPVEAGELVRLPEE